MQRPGEIKLLSYYGSYTSIFGSYDVNPISTGGKSRAFNGQSDYSYVSTDMYTYMHAIGHTINKYGFGLNVYMTRLRFAYYIGLARERWGSFNINNVNYELYGGDESGVAYFFNDIEITSVTVSW